MRSEVPKYPQLFHYIVEGVLLLIFSYSLLEYFTVKQF